MMISPQGYLMEHEKDSFAQLIKERESLLEEIKRLENIVFAGDKSDEAWMVRPEPDTRYQMNLAYFAELCKFMCEKFNRESDWGDELENMETRIEIRKTDITRLDTDAIVNAANDGLWEGGGVCGAIFRRAGSAELTKACREIGGCKVGNAVITPGFQLPANYIIHAVGPVWHGGNQNEPELLYSAYRQALLTAKEHECHSIGFPLISAGIYGYPKENAWREAIQSCLDFLNENPDYEMNIIFAVLDDGMMQLGQNVLEELFRLRITFEEGTKSFQARSLAGNEMLKL